MRKLEDTDFGEVRLDYKMVDLDGTNLEEAVEVVTPEGDFLGHIFSLNIEDVTKEDINNNCRYHNERDII